MKLNTVILANTEKRFKVGLLSTVEAECRHSKINSGVPLEARYHVEAGRGKRKECLLDPGS